MDRCEICGKSVSPDGLTRLDSGENVCSSCLAQIRDVTWWKNIVLLLRKVLKPATRFWKAAAVAICMALVLWQSWQTHVAVRAMKEEVQNMGYLLLVTRMNFGPTMDVDLSGIESDISSMELDISTIQSDVSGMESDMDSIRSDINTMEFDIGSMQTDMSSMALDISGMENGTSDVGSRLDSIESYVNIISSTLSSVETDIDSIESTVDSIESDVSHIKIWGVD